MSPTPVKKQYVRKKPEARQTETFLLRFLPAEFKLIDLVENYDLNPYKSKNQLLISPAIKSVIKIIKESGNVEAIAEMEILMKELGEMKEPKSNKLKQPTKSGSALAYIIENLDEISSARQRGVSRQKLVDDLKAVGFELTLPSFSTLLGQARHIKKSAT